MKRLLDLLFADTWTGFYVRHFIIVVLIVACAVVMAYTNEGAWMGAVGLLVALAAINVFAGNDSEVP